MNYNEDPETYCHNCHGLMEELTRVKEERNQERARAEKLREALAKRDAEFIFERSRVHKLRGALEKALDWFVSVGADGAPLPAIRDALAETEVKP